MTTAKFEEMLDRKLTEVFLRMIKEVPKEFRGTPVEGIVLTKQFMEFTNELTEKYWSMRDFENFSTEQIQKSVIRARTNVIAKFMD